MVGGGSNIRTGVRIYLYISTGNSKFELRY